MTVGGGKSPVVVAGCFTPEQKRLRANVNGSGIPNASAEIFGGTRTESASGWLYGAIQSLPEHYREVILLRDIEELSIDETTEVLSLTRESVKARIHRARLMIREYLVRD
ncbi:hypothetical protein JQ604_37360 [Bradyrhizobium jicamae]|nr:sigma factor-like helix-turn-helix DNA-binding protein [Bradyrhizobium jicamae]MBR0757882.1 hypothetical protein [Bradyrhizobium jicamae]